MSTKIIIPGIIVGVGTVIIYLYVAVQFAEQVADNPEPFIDAGETLLEHSDVICDPGAMFLNAIDNPMLLNVPDESREVLEKLRDGDDVSMCEMKILDEILTPMQKNRINYKAVGCDILECVKKYIDFNK